MKTNDETKKNSRITGKERITNILQKKSRDVICWTTLGPKIIGEEEISKLPILELYRHIGCDILQLGVSSSPSRFKQPDIEVKQQMNSDGSNTVTTTSKWGKLIAVWQNSHPLKYPVETIEDLRTFKNIMLNSFYEEIPGDEFERNVYKTINDIGDDGIAVNTIAPSPVQALLECDCGVINFYSLYQDYPEEMEELLDVMHHHRKQEYEILSKRTPLDCVIPIENTSTRMISPDLYEKLSLPQISDYVNILHKHNKLAVLHMCGHLKDLLYLFRDTGCDGINAVTLPPLGNTRFEDVLEVLGDDFIILGGIFSPFQDPNISKEEMWHELDKLYTPAIRNANLLLWMQADGVYTPYERFLWTKEWFEKQ